jgi:ribonuclease D
MTWTLIESDEALHDALSQLAGAADLAVDTEFMRRNTFYPQVALLQLCAGEHAYLVDPLRIQNLAPVRSLLTNPEVYKVLHSCSEDLEVFRHWLGVLPEPLIDTQRAAGLLGENFGLGYRALVEALLGISLDKGETRSDWLRRPLSESQCHYAAQDVLHLLPAWRILRERAERQGRLAWVLEEGREASAALADRDEELFRRVKGAGRLSGRQLEVLRRLCDWREERAKAADKPRGWVLDDKTCLAIARDMPAHREALAAIEGLPPAVLRRQGDAILALIGDARAADAAHLPAPSPRPLVAGERDRLKLLRERVRDLASAAGVAPEAALSTSDLELLVRQASGGREAEPRRWSGWRADAFITPLRESLAASGAG